LAAIAYPVRHNEPDADHLLRKTDDEASDLRRCNFCLCQGVSAVNTQGSKKIYVI
jgi:hypothetical protein